MNRYLVKKNVDIFFIVEREEDLVPDGGCFSRIEGDEVELTGEELEVMGSKPLGDLRARYARQSNVALVVRKLN